MKFKFSYDVASFSFILGCLPLLFLKSLPKENYFYLLSLTITFLFIGLIFIKQKIINLIFCFFIFFILGLIISTISAKIFLKNSGFYIDKKLEVIALVKSINTLTDTKKDTPQYNFIEFVIKNVNGKRVSKQIFSILWTFNDIPSAGETWRLTIKTKAIHSYLNEGGFDAQRFALSNRKLINATVIDATCLDKSINFRQKIVNKIKPFINRHENIGLLYALLIGDRTKITIDQKNIMAKTGIAHLMAISGMHITLVMMIFSWLTKKLQFFLPLKLINFKFPILIGYLFALLYAWLSGLNPPVLRAICALSLWLFFKWKNQILSPWQIIFRVIALLLLFDPLMILSESFWLSCYAVICLIFIGQWFKRSNKSYFYQLFKLQIILTLLLLPIQILIFNGIGLSSVIANMLAIPLVSLIIFPVLLLMLLFSFFNIDFIVVSLGFIADYAFEILFNLLKYLDNYWINFSAEYYLLSFSGWLIVIIYKLGLWRTHYIAISAIVFTLLSPFMKKETQLWRVDMLDVGHGLAILIRQGNKAILYDAAASWNTSTAAERIILPFIYYHNLTIKGIIISHEHDDHIGGLQDIQKAFPDAWLMSSSLALKNNFKCVSGNKLKWQDVNIAVISPEKMSKHAYNPESCVIKLTLGNESLLLTGDLEKSQELALVKEQGKALQATFLQIPHHGSNTSSSYPLLANVEPKYALGSISRYNQWHLPSIKVIKRYQKLNIPYYFTHQTGQISIFLYQNHYLIKSMRQDLKSRWYHDWFGTSVNYE